MLLFFFFFQAEDGIRDLVRSRGLGDVYKRQVRGRRLCRRASACSILPLAVRMRRWNPPSRRGEVQFMIRDEAIIREINALWLPVYPYMADHLLATSGVRAGRFLDLGPFAGGLALNILQECETLVVTVIDESELVLRWVEEKAAEGGYASRLTTHRRPVDPIPEADAGFDLVAARGAFFFLTPTLLQEIRRVLRP